MLQVRVRGRPGLRTPRVRRNLALQGGRAGEGERERSNPWRLAAGSPPGSVVGSGSHRGVAASQPPVCPGSPDIGEQKLSVPVATAAPAAAKFRGGGRRAAESPPPPPHPTALAAPPPPPPELSCGRAPPPAERPQSERRSGPLCPVEKAVPHSESPLPSVLPTAPETGWRCAPSWVSELRETPQGLKDPATRLVHGQGTRRP